MSVPKTLFGKIWDRHVVAVRGVSETLLYVDRCILHDGTMHVFDDLRKLGRGAARPQQIVGVADHFVPTANRATGIADAEIRGMVEKLERNTREFGLGFIGMDDPRQGIMHVVCPELGMTQPGMLIGGGDSHSSTHGAFGNLSFGIGASEVTHVMATQMIWQKKPRTLRVTIDGRLGFGVSAKDIILALIAKIGIGGATGHVIEYAGSTIRAMSMEERMTVCNMSIEAGGRAGMIAPDDTTYQYLHGRPYAPKGAMWDIALAFWRSLPGEPDAHFDMEIALPASGIVPMVSWGTNPEHSLPITGRIPDPAEATGHDKRIEIEAAIAYMGLKPGQLLTDIPIDRVFIGSCTNARIEDLRIAANVARLGRARVPAWVVPGSSQVKRQAEAEGLDMIFKGANIEWRDAGCSLCTALNGDILKPGERCASTSNRNFQGRQGTGGRTHLLSPAMAVAAALTGRLADVRQLMRP